jgi:rhodanese-related sulfurtransferase
LKEAAGGATYFIDVRSRAEWLKGHLPGAISLPLQDLNPNTNPVDLSKPSLIYCHEGFRATTAASILLHEGGAAVAILMDGFEGWSALGLALRNTGRVVPELTFNIWCLLEKLMIELGTGLRKLQ